MDHVKLALRVLLNEEDDFETKLNMLTEISIQTRCKETFSACEELRNLFCDEQIPNQGKDVLPSFPSEWGAY